MAFDFSYSKRKDGVIVRSDGVMIPLHEPDNICTQHYQEWVKGGGKHGEHKPTKAEAEFERGQEATREKIRALIKEHDLKDEGELWNSKP